MAWRHGAILVASVFALCSALLAQGADSHWVTNPTSGASLFVQVLLPRSGSDGALPALVLVPGGRSGADAFLRPAPGGSQAQEIANHGFAVLVFDPDGRGRSGGTEGDGGFIQQDGLAAVIRFAATLAEVDPARIGLVSYSYGVTMATGALARYPELPILFLMDWEGPANRDDTGGCGKERVGHLQGHPCSDESFWREREASTFILTLRIPYQRLQSCDDHAQPDADHALLLLANATSEGHGGHGQAPWTRLNDLEPNRVYTRESLPPLPPGGAFLQRQVGDYALELVRLFAPLD